MALSPHRPHTMRVTNKVGAPPSRGAVSAVRETHGHRGLCTGGAGPGRQREGDGYRERGAREPKCPVLSPSPHPTPKFSFWEILPSLGSQPTASWQAPHCPRAQHLSLLHLDVSCSPEQPEASPSSPTRQLHPSSPVKASGKPGALSIALPRVQVKNNFVKWHNPCVGAKVSM